MKNLYKLFLLIIILVSTEAIFSQQTSKDKQAAVKENLFVESTFSGLELRNIGPAFMSGRIADIAIHPTNRNTWFVAVGSGNVWKTTNAGITWTPIFDQYGSYSTGCITIDNSNPEIIWLGTGENVGGRHVAYGDGVYKSENGGNSWTNMGLKESHHISKIIVHPTNSNIVWVAAQGPLWAKGGDRGIFKTTDGGKSWKRVLGDTEWVGATDIVIDPRNPDVLYAATWQRQRNIAVYLGGGPGSGIYRSVNGGDTWEKLTNGLPTSNMGKIGLAISPQKPDVIYADIELDRRTGGLYRSVNRGTTWEKRSDAVSGATGPHYYQELYASPHQFDKIYLVDFLIQISEDGGKTFRTMKEDCKHSDNHSIAFQKDDPNYLLVGTDGGIYETYDLAENWRYIANLPVTQFYKVAVDDTEPFYRIYGGTQDNSTEGGPSRTDNVHGIMNSDWEIVLFADGHQPATEPGNPSIVYAEWQEGNLVRTDRTTGEIVHIQPQPDEGEGFERFNWDSPILISSHSSTRLYYASQRVWRSDDRGDSWKPISGDLTNNQERITLPIMDKTWSYDSPWDFEAMSNYNTITSLAESSKQEGVIYAGTDDGNIQITEDGGNSWRKVPVSSMPGVPKTAFVNDIKADLFDANTVYVVLDNHKFGDLNPYLFKSTDRGKTWKSIKGNIPDRTIIWRIVQDYIKPELLFLGTEFGLYFSIDGGNQWVKLSGKVPTISFRDLAIQKRENDLVGATFGRGFYILDDYSALRSVTEDQLKQEAVLYPLRKAWWYIPRSPLGDERGSFGASLFRAPNPPFGAVFTYYLGKDYKTQKSIRQEKEKELMKQNLNVPFPGWDALDQERRQEEPKIWITIKDSKGEVVRKLSAPTGKGFHRIAWDLRYPSTNAIDINSGGSGYQPQGVMAAPGKYTATLSKQIDSVITDLYGPVEFAVEQMRKGALTGSSPEETAKFWNEVAEVMRVASATSLVLDKALKKVDGMQRALLSSSSQPGKLDAQLYKVKQDLLLIEEQFYGKKSKTAIGEKNSPNVYSRLGAVQMGVMGSTYGPTKTHRRSLELARKELNKIKASIEQITNVVIPNLEKEVIKHGAPWIEGNQIP